LEPELQMLRQLEAEAIEAEFAREPDGWQAGNPSLQGPASGAPADSFDGEEEMAADWWGAAAV
jgi:hypothetical protein